jgi:glutathionylspermidine synthase
VNREHTASAADAVAFWETFAGQPYVVRDPAVMSADDVAALRVAAGDAWHIFARVAPLIRALPDDGLRELGIPEAALDAVRAYDPLAGETLVARFDFLREGDVFRVIELNAETPFFVVESYLESGRRARAAGLDDPNAGCREALGAALVQAIGATTADTRIGVVASNVHREDAGTAAFYVELLRERVTCCVEFVGIHELRAGDGRAGDAHGPLDIIVRCYPLEHMAADSGGAHLFAALRAGTCRLINPPSALPLQSKATQALIWGLYQSGAYFDAAERAVIERIFLRTVLDLPDDEETWVRKPVLGREGGGVVIVRAGEVLARGGPGYDMQPMVYQRRVAPTHRRVRFADGAEADGEELLTCFIVAGAPSAVGMRIGGPITDARAWFAPVGVAPRAS